MTFGWCYVSFGCGVGSMDCSSRPISFWLGQFVVYLFMRVVHNFTVRLVMTLLGQTGHGGHKYFCVDNAPLGTLSIVRDLCVTYPSTCGTVPLGTYLVSGYVLLLRRTNRNSDLHVGLGQLRRAQGFTAKS